MIEFTKERVLSLYRILVEETGGTFGVREESLLDSAIFAPYQTFDGIELFPTMIEKAARLGYGLVSNHPFIDGNKRIGVFIMLTFLSVNGIILEFTDEEIVFIAMSIADSKMDYENLKNILITKLKK